MQWQRRPARRRAAARTLRPAGRTHQRRRDPGARRRRRLCRAALGAGRHRRAARHAGHRRAPPRRPRARSRTTSSPPNTTSTSRSIRRVLSYVELFSGRLKGYLEEGLSRGARYLPMMQEVFRAEGLPLDLAYVPLVESAFKPSALSRAKARGVWQFMSGTGIENGLQHDWYIDERADPREGHAGRCQVPQVALQPVRRLAPGAGLVQRRARPRAALDEALGQGRLLGHLGQLALPAARDAQLRAADPGGHHRGAEPGAVRARHRARGRAAHRRRAADGAGRPAPHRRVDRRARAGAAGPESGTAPVDDAGADDRLRPDRADGQGRQS